MVTAVRGWPEARQWDRLDSDKLLQTGYCKQQAYKGLGVTEKPHLGPGWLGKGGFLLLPEPNALHPRTPAFLPQHLPSSATCFPYTA